jgi:hypothetical protein
MLHLHMPACQSVHPSGIVDCGKQVVNEEGVRLHCSLQ